MQLPILTEPFQTMEEVDAYLSGNSIQCLVCGKQLQRLNLHVQRLHNLSFDEYRSRFGIPAGRSLTSAPSRAKSGAAMTPERIALLKSLDVGHHPNARRGSWSRGRVPAVVNLWKKNAETGRYFARQPVVVPCATCGCPMSVTALGATQPIRCMTCTTPGAFKARVSYWRRKRAA